MTDKVHFATVVLALGVPPVEHDVCLKASNLCDLETELGVSAWTLLPDTAGNLPFGLREARAILHHGLRGAGKNASKEAVAAFLENMKPGDILTAAVKAIVAAFFPKEKTEDPALVAARVKAEAEALAAPKVA